MITSLKVNQIFVFGSNNNGDHAGGAARTAADKFGAVNGVRMGLQGQSYAIPTMSRDMIPLSLDSIEKHISRFLYFARQHPEFEFLLTKIGCGIAGYSETNIEPMFSNAPNNVVKPGGWS